MGRFFLGLIFGPSPLAQNLIEDAKSALVFAGAIAS